SSLISLVLSSHVVFLFCSSFLLFFFVFFFIDPSTPEIYTLSLHDALPIFCRKFLFYLFDEGLWCDFFLLAGFYDFFLFFFIFLRSEEHTSELQSRENLVCRLLLEKKKRVLNCSKMSKPSDIQRYMLNRSTR